MSKALRLSALAIAGATTTGLIGFTAPALADGGGAYKRDNDSGQVVTTMTMTMTMTTRTRTPTPATVGRTATPTATPVPAQVTADRGPTTPTAG